MWTKTREYGPSMFAGGVLVAVGAGAGVGAGANPGSILYANLILSSELPADGTNLHADDGADLHADPNAIGEAFGGAHGVILASPDDDCRKSDDRATFTAPNSRKSDDGDPLTATDDD